jgi:2-dehydropantoate 2-reductase
MKVLIVGPGALGCLLAAKLSQDHEVWLLDHDPDRAAHLAAAGLVLEEGGERTRHFVRATAEAEEVGAVELALLCVKSRKVEGAVIGAQPALRRAKLFLALQNGLGHLEVLPGLCRSSCWGLGVTTQGATLAGTGLVRHRGSGPTWIGLPPSLRDKQADQSVCRMSLLLAAETLSKAGIPTEAVADILPRLWDKLLVNVGINALTAINDCPNGALLDDTATVELMMAAVSEGAMVATRLGVILEREPLTAVREVCRATATNISSMLQDVRSRRATEIEAINGAVVRLAESLGIPAPVNEGLLRKVRELERNYHVFC